MAAAYPDYAECGLCCKKNEALVNPKLLRCGHVHCLPCLTEALRIARRNQTDLECAHCK